MSKRRGNGEGTIHKRSRDGLYEAKFTVQTEFGPKRKTIYARTRKEAAQKLSEALANRDKGIVVESGAMTVAAWMERWLEDSVKGSVSRRTYGNYRLQVRRHIIPALGALKLGGLNPSHIQSLYAAKLRG